jgi:hypothetical protein
MQGVAAKNDASYDLSRARAILKPLSVGSTGGAMSSTRPRFPSSSPTFTIWPATKGHFWLSAITLPHEAGTPAAVGLLHTGTAVRVSLSCASVPRPAAYAESLDGNTVLAACVPTAPSPRSAEPRLVATTFPARLPLDPESWPQHLDALAAAPEHHRLLLENPAVRVLDTCIPAGDTTPLHCHAWPSVLYILSWSSFVRRDAAGKVLLDSRTTPQLATSPGALWSPPLGPHTLENVGIIRTRRPEPRDRDQQVVRPMEPSCHPTTA